MLKFLRGKGQHQSAERQKLQQGLFSFKKLAEHGFPSKPTALAWDPELRVMAIATASGVVKIFGKPGVEFYGRHENEMCVTKLIFVPSRQGVLVSLCEDNSLHLWKITGSRLEEIKELTLEGKLKKISAWCVSNNSLLVGTEGGNVFAIDLNDFTPTDTIIYQDVVTTNVGDDFKACPGPVEALAARPGWPERVLVGYAKGLIVEWDWSGPRLASKYICSQGVESLSWAVNGDKFASSHNDGSYILWTVPSGDSQPSSQLVSHYGPYSCKPISKLLLAPSPSGQGEMVAFTGGLARNSYSDKNTVSVLDGERHIVLDVTSKIIDFFIASPTEGTFENDCGSDSASHGESQPQRGTVVVVLAEEELIAVDATPNGNWKMLPLPYMSSLHASAVTATALVCGVAPQLVARLRNACQLQAPYSTLAWPVDGGWAEVLESEAPEDILLTGHEDGSVRAWETVGPCLLPLLSFSSSAVLSADGDDDPLPLPDEDEWPPFRKVGKFDPYSDDPRFAVKKIEMCPETGKLAVGGTAGQIIVASLSETETTLEHKSGKVSIVSGREGFVWKGASALGVKGKGTPAGPGWVATEVVQLEPPASITALALAPSLGLLAAGTAHGLAVWDFVRNAPVATKCTLPPAAGPDHLGDGPISRRKSFKKSLRESFRRLRRGRSGRTARSPAPAPDPTPDTRPVERAVEARAPDDTMGSIVRCFTFANTNVVNFQTLTQSLWAGTNNGTVYIFTLNIPGNRKEESVSCMLGKEIQLKHRAPVISVSLIDSQCMALTHPVKPPPHTVVIASEEQVKLFSIPNLRPVVKLKLTAGEGARVRRAQPVRFERRSPHPEPCLIILTNLGDLIVHSLPDLRRLFIADLVKREDINGISSTVLNNEGDALYMHSSSELQRVSLSAARQLPRPPRIRHPDLDHPTDSGITSPSGGDSSIASTVRENGVSESASSHDVTLSSVGDITIDSVKDHLTNNLEETRTVTTSETVTIKSGEAEVTTTVVETVTVKGSETSTTIVSSTTTNDTAAMIVSAAADSTTSANTEETRNHEVNLAGAQQTEV